MIDPDRRHLIAYVAAAALLIVIASQFLGREGAEQPSVSLAASQPAEQVEAAARPRAKRVWVDVAGAVRAPGLYAFAADARVAAAITRAGGVTRRADRSAVNLAAKLVDGQQVFVPARVAGGGSGGVGAGGAPGAAGSGASASGASAAAGAAGAPGPTAPSGQAVSLSTATSAQLEQLDGIGPALAARIIEYREQNGGFRSIDQLREVSGIGDKRLEALKGAVAP